MVEELQEYQLSEWSGLLRPSLWHGGIVVSSAVLVAIGVTSTCRREVLGAPVNYQNTRFIGVIF